MNSATRLLMRGVPSFKEDRVVYRGKRMSSNGGNGSTRHHPRHRNGNNVKQGKCPICVILHGEENVKDSEIEDHHVIPRRYGGKNGPKKQLCPDHHMMMHLLYDDFVEALVMQNFTGFVEIN